MNIQDGPACAASLSQSCISCDVCMSYSHACSCVNLAVLKSNGNFAFPLFFVSWVGVFVYFFIFNEELFFLIRYFNGYL